MLAAHHLNISFVCLLPGRDGTATPENERTALDSPPISLSPSPLASINHHTRFDGLRRDRLQRQIRQKTESLRPTEDGPTGLRWALTVIPIDCQPSFSHLSHLQPTGEQPDHRPIAKMTDRSRRPAGSGPAVDASELARQFEQLLRTRRLNTLQGRSRSRTSSPMPSSSTPTTPTPASPHHPHHHSQHLSLIHI